MKDVVVTVVELIASENVAVMDVEIGTFVAFDVGEVATIVGAVVSSAGSVGLLALSPPHDKTNVVPIAVPANSRMSRFI